MMLLHQIQSIIRICASKGKISPVFQVPADREAQVGIVLQH